MNSELEKLIKLISVWHLIEVAKRESPYAWECAIKILDTGKLLDTPYLTEEELERDDIEFAGTLSNPKNWGIADEEWKRMVKSWETMQNGTLA